MPLDFCLSADILPKRVGEFPNMGISEDLQETREQSGSNKHSSMLFYAPFCSIILLVSP